MASVTAPLGFPISRLSLSPGTVPPPPPEENGLIVISSILILLVPPDTFLTENLTAPDTFTVKLAVASEVDEEVTVLPTLLQVLPLLVLIQSSQVLLPSAP